MKKAEVPGRYDHTAQTEDNQMAAVSFLPLFYVKKGGTNPLTQVRLSPHIKSGFTCRAQSEGEHPYLNKPADQPRGPSVNGYRLS